MKMKCLSFCVASAFVFFFSCNDTKPEEYVCKPCNLPCDTLQFQAAGTCPHCRMELIPLSQVIKERQLAVNEVVVEAGSGVFLVDGGHAKAERTIRVHYHKPEGYTEDSKILLVIPGAGRNADSYRDAWINHAEKYNVLILSPSYSEDAYPFEQYHLGGVVRASNLLKIADFKPNSNQVAVNEDELIYELSTDRKEWVFKDFDRIFDLVVEELNSTQLTYDIFGHSAGGQILHRLAILETTSKANRIIAANSGFYTLPSQMFDYPFGIKNLAIAEEDLYSAFEKKLVLLVGELDNEKEQGGTLLISQSANKQGAHRLARAKYFFDHSKAIAQRNNMAFNWTIEAVTNVGHNHQLMGAAAASLLYGKEE